jgi:hypothetical protein
MMVSFRRMENLAHVVADVRDTRVDRYSGTKTPHVSLISASPENRLGTRGVCVCVCACVCVCVCVCVCKCVCVCV